MRWIIRLAVLGLLLVLAHRLAARHGDLASMSDAFAGEQHAIHRVEGDLDDLDGQIDHLAARLRDLDERLTARERENGGSVPQAEYDAYLRLVDERNAVAAEHDGLLDYRARARRDYEEQVERHNAGVAEANALARRATPLMILRELWHDLTARWGRG